MPAAESRHGTDPGAWTLADAEGSLEQAIGKTEQAIAKPEPAEPYKKPEPVPQTILRLRFSRGGPATWLAHLDLMRTFERSVRRAALPVQWSAGFNPRPDLVFALPIGVGLETCADYVDIGLIHDIQTGPNAPAVSDFIARLAVVLPDGLAIISGRLQHVEKESIMGRIAVADYHIEAVGLAAAAERAMTLPTLVIDKPSKGKTLKVDIRPLIIRIIADSPDRLRLRVRAGSRENLRPDLFLLALTQMGGLDETAAADARLVRTGLYLSARDAGEQPADPEGKPMPSEPAGCP